LDRQEVTEKKLDGEGMEGEEEREEWSVGSEGRAKREEKDRMKIRRTSPHPLRKKENRTAARQRQPVRSLQWNAENFFSLTLLAVFY
jgi:hypothetical protein